MARKQPLFLLSGTDQLLLALPKSSQKARPRFIRSGPGCAAQQPSHQSTPSGIVPVRGNGGSPRLFLRNSAEVVGCTNMATGLIPRGREQPGQLARQSPANNSLYTRPCLVLGCFWPWWSEPGTAVVTTDNSLWRTNAAFRPTEGRSLVWLSVLATADQASGIGLAFSLPFARCQKEVAWFLARQEQEVYIKAKEKTFGSLEKNRVVF